MKRTGLRLLPLLLSLVLLVSCAQAPELELTEEGYVHEKTGVAYVPADAYYEAIAIDKDLVIARIANDKIDDDLFYAIDGVASEQMIATERYEIFCAVDKTLPTLAQMSPWRALICKTATLSYSVASIEEEADLKTLLGVYAMQGFPEEDLYCDDLTPEQYDIKFESSEHPAFYYVLKYRSFSSEVLVYEVIADENDFIATYPGGPVTTETFEDEVYAVNHFGSGLLYDQVTHTYYPVGTLIQDYLDGAEVEGTGTGEA